MDSKEFRIHRGFDAAFTCVACTQTKESTPCVPTRLPTPEIPRKE